MKLIETRELERLVRDTFAEKHLFSVEAELGLSARRSPVVTFVHGGPDPFLDRQFDAWLRGLQTFVAVHQILNALCRAGVLPPGEYGVSRGAQSAGAACTGSSLDTAGESRRALHLVTS